MVEATAMPTGLALYTQAAEASASRVITTYSTSFGWAAKLLGRECRQPVENIYALVRVADEIVDGSAAEAASYFGNAKSEAAGYLTELEREVYRALKTGYSTNLVVHAFVGTAIRVGIGEDLIKPFFASMRADLTAKEHTPESFELYVYGSAEVVGLMCLKVFVHGHEYSAAEHEQLVRGARALGAAFQKVNFLRDLAADFKKLGRSYFPGVNVSTFDEAQKLGLVADIEDDLAVSLESLPLLPASARRAVAAAQMLFGELNLLIWVTPADELIETRISVPTSKKLFILLKAILTGRA